MEEELKNKSKRDLLLERMRTRYPDKKFEDDEELFGQISEEYDTYDKDISGYKDREEKISTLFASDPRSARLFIDWRDGKDLISNLVRLYGDDLRAALDDPSKLEELAEANKEYMERVAQNELYEVEYEKNMAETLARLEKTQQAKGLSDTDLDTAMEWLTVIAKDFMMGKISDETIEMAIKAQNFDAAVEQAEQEGEVRGKNAKIEEKLRKSTKGDGTAALSGKNGSNGGNRAVPDLGAIDRYGVGATTIWERGDMKRKRV